jgi:hypothetical protein
MAYMVKEVMKKWQRGALSLLSAPIAAAALGQPPAQTVRGALYHGSSHRGHNRYLDLSYCRRVYV